MRIFRVKIQSKQNSRLVWQSIFTNISSLRTISFALVVFMLSINAQDQKPESAESPDSTIKEFSNSINFCPVALAFKFYSINYYHLFEQKHGIELRLDYESNSDSYSDNPVDIKGYGVILNYRYHFAESMESIFLGSYVRYRIYNGVGNADGTDFDFDIKEFTVGLNVGKRWVWDFGLNLTFTVGYGISSEEKTVTPSTKEVSNTIDAFQNEYAFIGPFFGEFSIGYTF